MKKFLTRYLIPYLPPLAYVMWVVLVLITTGVFYVIKFFNPDFDTGEGTGMMLSMLLMMVSALISYVTYWLGVALNTVRGIRYFRKATGRQLKVLSMILITASLAQIYFLIGFRSTGLAVFGIVNWFASSDFGIDFGVQLVLPILVVSVPILDWLIRRQQKLGYLFRRSNLNED